jgi:uncharacterized paraquat-inducible protein A
MGTTDCLTCRLCGQEHRRIHLEPGEKELCIRCNAMLEKGARSGLDTALAFSVAGLALCVPATVLPFVSAGAMGGVSRPPRVPPHLDSPDDGDRDWAMDGIQRSP